MNIKYIGIKKIIIYSILIVISVITGKAMLRVQDRVANYYDHDALITLEECVKARCHAMTAASATDYEGYEKLVSLERGLLSYDGLNFNHREIQLYIDGVYLQNHALTYYQTDHETFLNYWYDGHVKRRDALKALLGQRLITLPDDIRAQIFIGALKNDISHTIAGDATLTWDEEMHVYYVEKELINTTDMALKNVRLQLSLYDDHTYSKDMWLPDETWAVRLYAPQDVDDRKEVKVTIKFLNYTYGSYTYTPST